MLPLTAQVTDDQGRTYYQPIGLTLLPEFFAREAARFASYRWGEWATLAKDIRVGVVAHYMAQRLFAAHESDALALKAESR